MVQAKMFVFSNPVEGMEDTFNKWYDSQHLSDVVAVPGVTAGQRYALAPMKMPEGEAVPVDLPAPAHRYLAVYELDDDPDTVMKAFLAKVAAGEMPLSEALDLTTISLSTWTPRGDRLTAE